MALMYSRLVCGRHYCDARSAWSLHHNLYGVCFHGPWGFWCRLGSQLMRQGDQVELSRLLADTLIVVCKVAYSRRQNWRCLPCWKGFLVSCWICMDSSVLAGVSPVFVALRMNELNESIEWRQRT